MKYFKKVVGERLYLSPINPDDAELYTKWMNDYAVAGYLQHFTEMLTIEGERKALERIANEGQNYAIVLHDNDTLIGNISFEDISYVNRRAMLAIFIGEAEYRDKGYGAEAIRLLLNYAFKTLNFHNIMLLAHSDNERGIACYRKVGFREFGRRREAKFKDGRYIDNVYMDILSTEFDGTI